MRKNLNSKIFLLMFFALTILFGIGHNAYGMFNNQGQWICSGEIDIEISYYNTYTDTFQNAIDEIYLIDGATTAQSYFEFAVKEEIVGQDWKRSQDCLIKLGIDTRELSSIVIPTYEQIQDLPPNSQIKPPVGEMEILIPIKEEIPSFIEKPETEASDNSNYAVGVIVIVIIIVIVAFAFYLSKSRKKYLNSVINSKKDYNNNHSDDDKAKDKEHHPHENVEIEVTGGVEK